MLFKPDQVCRVNLQSSQIQQVSKCDHEFSFRKETRVIYAH
jgi:hypothetical protein